MPEESKCTCRCGNTHAALVRRSVLCTCCHYRECPVHHPTPELPDGYFYPGDILAYRALVAQVPDGGRIAELGCYKGRSLCSIVAECKRRGIKVFGVDTWHYAEDAWVEFIENVEKCGVTARGLDADVVSYRMTSFAASLQFENASLDLVFIDTPHDYPTVIADLRAWLPKVKPGGIIAGHDYCPQHPGVAKALDEMFGQMDLRACVNETDYSVCWMKRVGLNAIGGNLCH